MDLLVCKRCHRFVGLKVKVFWLRISSIGLGFIKCLRSSIATDRLVPTVPHFCLHCTL